ncbi:DUF3486 family protein [Pseudodesulfovibrio sp. JC047]|uniref:DUF3486 family protein n=1 Tax=Pseudodesulfovibrio sp. JC047 TaxID=2683199 RepID=UPI0013D88BCB|nr:DUF3486 family protein [Pseudodesulfovibrio sp. JC047]NDV20869.1 DUF3486 family protein [Pseudodesulfovibrio sp. JC047]
MPRRSAVDMLPKEVKEWLDRALADGGFADYRLLADELKDRGFEISKSAVHRYGQKFEDRLASLKLVTEQSRAIVLANPDDDNAINDALMRLTQEKLFGILMEMEVDPSKINMAGITRSIAELGRASVTQKKWMAEAREQARKEAEEQMVKAVEEAAKKDGGKTSAEDVLSHIKAIYRGEA